MDDFLYKSLLYDYYNGLLTDKQREIYAMYYHNDMSLSEIAENSDTTPQAVSDMLKRVNKLLVKYEDNLKLVENRLIIKEKLEAAAELLETGNADKIKEILESILDSI
ncbi:MAG: DNA-binding protein [Defluviitaleaceae bacterium]|nr:DNA-binding protein [Defluviitaleaceae bacterium]